MPSLGVNQTQEIYESIIDEINGVLVGLNEEFQVTLFNRTAARFFNKTHRSAADRTAPALLEEGGNDETVRELFSGRKLKGETRLTLRDGRGRHVSGNAKFRAVRDDNGAFAGGYVIFWPEEIRTAPLEKARKTEIKTRNRKVLEILSLLSNVARTETTVIIGGEEGSGRKLLACSIHHKSNRNGDPFVPLNCSAIPEVIREAEIFGYVEGAVEGLNGSSVGNLGESENGTLLIEDLDALSGEMRKRLVDAICTREYFQVGADEPRSLNARVVLLNNTADKNNDGPSALQQEIMSAIPVICFELPALRERREDIPVLIDYFFEKFRSNNSSVEGIHPEAMRFLLEYDYPGNVAELERIVEHAFLICNEGEICREHIPTFVISGEKANGKGRLKPLEESERVALIETLRQNNWCKQETARVLGVTRTTLWRKMKKYNIKTPSRGRSSRK